MDSTAQSTTQVAQQVPPQQPPAAPSVPSSVSQISIGREQGPVQVASDKEDDAVGAQQYTPVQSQAPSEVVRSAPQEAVVSAEFLRPSNPEVVIPQEIDHVVEKLPQSVAGNTDMVPPGALNQHMQPAGAGVPVPQNDFGMKTLPLSYMEAEELEKKSKINEPRHWLAAKVEYLWRKMNPNLK